MENLAWNRNVVSSIIDQIINRGIRGYKSRSEFIKEAIRKRFEELNLAQPTSKLVRPLSILT